MGLGLPEHTRFDLGIGIDPPVLLILSTPRLSAAAHRAGWDLEVHVCGEIAADGKVTEARAWVERVLMLDDQGVPAAVQQALLRWRFFPALADGNPVQARICTIATFEPR